MSRLRVTWVSFAPVQRTPGGWTSDVASVRYRVAATSAALAALGVESRVTFLGPGANRRTLLDRFSGSDAVVLGKPVVRPERFAGVVEQALGLVAELRARKIRVIADYCDDHFSDPVMGAGYRALANAADRVTATTPGLAEVIARHAANAVSVITDLVEGSRGEPKVTASDGRVRLLWFGHPANLATLNHGLPQIQKVQERIASLTLVTAPGAGAEQLGARFRPWSPAAVFEELRSNDAVIIPSDPYDPRKAVKSPNRFAETVWAGRFAIAHPLPAYQPLAGGGWVGDDLAEGIGWYADNPGAALERIRAGQDLVAERHSPQAVGAEWRRVIEQTLQAR